MESGENQTSGSGSEAVLLQEMSVSEEEQFMMQMKKSLQQNFDVLINPNSPEASDPEAILQHNLEVLSKLLFPIGYLFSKLNQEYQQGLPNDSQDGCLRISEAFRAALGEALELTTVVQANAQAKLLAAKMIATLSSELQNIDVNNEDSVPQRLKELQTTAVQKLQSSLSHKINLEDINRLMAMLQDLVYNINTERNRLMSMSSDMKSKSSDGWFLTLWYDFFLTLCAYCCCASDALEKASDKANERTSFQDVDEVLGKCHRLAEKYAVLMKDLHESKASVTILKHHITVMCNGADILQEYANIWQMLKDQHVYNAATDYIKKNEKSIEAAKALEESCVQTLENWLDRSSVSQVERPASRKPSQ